MKLCNTQLHLSLLKEGKEKGLDYFYQKYFDTFCYRAERATEDLCAAESIVQEAFFRLWLFREQIKDSEAVFNFLKKQIRAAIGIYYTKTRNRFQRSLLRLDSIEDYQEFMLGYDMETEDEIDTVYLEQLEEEKQSQLEKLNKLLPFLSEQQQNFIKLCLRYSFNYERIAYYLGGISDYEVSLQVEKTINALRQIFQSQDKLNILNTPSSIKLEGEFSAEQAEVLRMRYELQMSFDEISESLQLSSSLVKKIFIEARAKVKSTKKTA
ncbi:RNA polymerase sigma factor [Sphingobacterium faecale]|uniref:Sigma-70 family RNA polymerase sigma factor n=1 Tax=Sphingobacterium faecale TaxID=2803775 RepID=A0ABS1RAP9_9SPHI|nr:sigma-70 family RNA polymerase sigma factor [Sphingobacterium faecale]MBL1411309.1 sigma-70 family RNA polymerase sigma factor [Sphingobacterium faecale]